MANIIPNIFLTDLPQKKIDFENDVIKIALFTNSYDPAALKNVVSYNDIMANELANPSYVKGGYEVTGCKVNKNLNDVTYDIDDIQIVAGNTSFTPVRYAVMYNTSNNNNLIYVIDFDKLITVHAAGILKINIDAAGILRNRNI